MLEPIRPGLSETIPGCIRIEPTASNVLSSIFSRLPISSDDILVDIGCGDGDVIAHWLSMGLRNELIGIELDQSTFRTTKERFRQPNVSIRWGNAAVIPPIGTIYYLFNPFRGQQMVAFDQAVPKTARIVYYNPTEIAVFKDWKVEEIWSTHPKAVLISR